MVEFTAEDRRRIMDRIHNIRNISLISHLDHGKSSLTDSLVASPCIIAQCDAQMTDARADEAQHGITTKSTDISLYYQMRDEDLKGYKGYRDGNEYLINLIDLPGNVDFSSEVTAALRISDGALVAVDCIEGVCAQTETALYKALCERVHPVLTVNNLDQFFLDPEYDGEAAYQKIRSVIEKVNVAINSYSDSDNDFMVYPNKGTVAFSGGLHGWAITLTNFAKRYANMCRVRESKMIERMWGENFYDKNTKKWTKENTGAITCKRGFVYYFYDPIKEIINACIKDNKDHLWDMLAKVGMTMESDEKELKGKLLLKCVMQNWFPASTALLEMIIFHLPSPHTAQDYRFMNLYTGKVKDDYANAIKSCNRDGPLMLYMSKMIPASTKGRFFAFGRVFAGKVSTDMNVRIMGPNFVPGKQKDLYVQRVHRTLIWMGKKQETVNDVPCGNIVAIEIDGLDKIINTATLTNVEHVGAYPICTMKFSVSPVVRIEVRCTVASDLSKLIKVLEQLAESDPMVVHTNNKSGAQFVAGASELHLKACLEKLNEEFKGHGLLEISKPVVSFRETVLQRSCRTMMIKSPSEAIRLCMKARPIGDRLVTAIEASQIGPLDDCGDVLFRDFGNDVDIANKIWCYGPNDTGPNMVVDMCEGDSSAIKQLVVDTFQAASKEGVLAGENMWGICFELQDFFRGTDVLKRKLGGSRLAKAAKKVIYASQLTAEPRLLEPVYLVEIQSLEKAYEDVKTLLNQRRGEVFGKNLRLGYDSLYDIKAYLPVSQSIGFYCALRAVTSGQALLSQCVFDHWAIMPGDPREASSVAGMEVASIRKRKGLDEKIPQLSEFEDEDEL